MDCHQAKVWVRVKFELLAAILLEGISRSISSMPQLTRLIYHNFKTIIVAMVVSLVVICFSVGESSIANDRAWSRDSFIKKLRRPL